MPDQATVRRALQRAEFVVVQEAFATTATCAYADLLLPATTWGEKDGTVTNSERRISRVRAAVPPPGQARHDWSIVVDVRAPARNAAASRPARRCFRTRRPNRSGTSIANRRADATSTSPASTGACWSRRRSNGPTRQAPPVAARVSTPTASSRPPTAARASPTWRYAALAEPRDARYPFSLTTGRLRDQWHGMSRTGTLGRLFGHAPEPCVELSAADMARLQLIDGDLVHVTSRRGSIVLPARASTQLASMQAFVAMHWGEEFVGGSSAIGAPLAGINALTAERLLPAVEAAGAEACRGKGAQGRIAVAPASRWRGCRRRAPRCASACGR